ncbi:DUF1206 domain-containing protein [Arundinibacter roseus]|uniref:DUF1206 domain-containing protein n=1 Tax=Arundinibacter roseus TaxID=2070510 RepID=A0A4R4KAS6_9BACT|nr:DUF1206 domain-containing protein [Arundinibacter roseus]
MEGAARAGLIAKGVVYSLIGILTATTAFELGRNADKGSRTEILNWIEKQPFGQILLGLTALGLLCYAIWRCIEAIKDTNKKGNSAKGLGKRAAYLASGLAYGASTFYAVRLLIGSGSSGNGDSRQTLVQKLLEQPYGQWLVGLLAVGTMAVGVYQIYYALSEKYRKKIRESKLRREIQGTLIHTGKAGYIARGIVWLIIGYLFLKAAIQSDPSEAGGSDSAFSFVENEYGTVILGIIALGLLCYGVFMFVRARYQPIQTR